MSGETESNVSGWATNRAAFLAALAAATGLIVAVIVVLNFATR